MKATIRFMTIFAALALTAMAQMASATDYYVSHSAGNDRIDGLSAKPSGVHGPWKTLAKASEVTYHPGDRLLLKCGDVWNEMLTLKGNGTAANPITVASYGAGDRPYIKRNLGKDQECILINLSDGNARNYTFRDLEIGNALNGVHVQLKANGQTDSGEYRFENCFFHDLKNPTFPKNAGAWGWALLWDGSGAPRVISIVHTIGLRTQGFLCNSMKGKVLLDGDTISHGSLNQVCQTYSTGFDITNCTFVYNYPWLYDKWGTTQVMAGILKGAPGIRNHVENNEFGWPGDYPGSPDGCGYDFEVGTDDVTFKNNYVHDSYGEAVLFMGNTIHNGLVFDNNVFRGNVRFSPRWSCTISLPMNVTGSGTFNNNVFYLWPGKSAFGTKDPLMKPTSFTYKNNNEHPTKPFVAMPLVTKIGYNNGSRVYTLSSATPGAVIRYTTDASLPSPSSPIYRKPIVMKRSGVLNAKAFKNDSYPSYVNSLAVELRNPKSSAPSAWWKLNESRGKTVKDSTGKSNGVLTNAVWAPGKASDGLAFNGKNASVKLTNSNLSIISNTFTIAFWAKPTKNRAATPTAGSGIGLTGTAWWKMNEGSGESLGDSAGGTLGSLSGCSWTKGKFGNALLFNADKASVSLTNYGTGLSSCSNTFSISFWVNPDAPRAVTPEARTGISGLTGQRYALYPQQYGGTTNEAGVGLSVGTNGISVFELADSHMPSPLVYDHTITGWNCITLVYRDKKPSLYINGQLVKEGLKSSKTLHPAFSLGGSTDNWYQGKLDDLRVYPYALADAQINELVNKGEAAMLPWSVGTNAGTS